MDLRGTMKRCPFIRCLKCDGCSKIGKVNWKEIKKMSKIYFAVFFLMFFNSFTITSMFPYLPFMVKFLLGVSDIELGNYVGIIPMAMFLGRFFGSYVWGTIADNKGRKPVLLLSCIFISISALSFGFTVTFAMGIFLRFLVGLSNAIPGTVKAVLSESSSDKSQAFGMGVFSCGWGLGLVIGPAVGGALADPLSQYNLTQNGDGVFNGTNSSSFIFLEMFPYSLPSIVNGILGALAVLTVVFLLPETLHSKSKQKYEPVTEDIEMTSVSDHLTKASSVSSSTSSLSASVNDSQCEEAKLMSVDTFSETDKTESGERHEEATGEPDSISISVANEKAAGGSETAQMHNETETFEEDADGQVHRVPFSVDRRNSANVAFFSGSVENLLKETDGLHFNSLSAYVRRRSSSLKSSLGQRDCLGCCNSCPRLKLRSKNFFTLVKQSLKNIWSFMRDRQTRMTVIIYSVYSFAVIGLDEIYSVWCKTDPDLGGLGLTLKEVGFSLAIIGSIQFLFNMWSFPLFERKLGTKMTFQICCILLMSSTFFLPFITYAAREERLSLLWGFLIVGMSFIRVGIVICFAAASIFVNNSVYFEQLASVNGLSMTLTSLTRTISPVIGGTIWAASLGDASRSFGFPINFHLIFVLLSSVFLICIILVSTLPKSIDKQKKRPEDDCNANNRKAKTETENS